MPYNKVVDRMGNILIDLTSDTVTEDKVAFGETFHDKHGNLKTGNKVDFTKKVEDKFLDLTKVNFVDYDGTLIASYTVEEARSLTALPDFPDHSDIGLVADGWSEELEYVKSLNYGFIIGLHVKPVDNATVIEFIGSANETYTMKIYSDSYNSTDKYKYNLTINWGDGETVQDAVNSSTNYKTFTHTYQKTGIYTIRILSQEAFHFSGSDNSGIFSTKAHQSQILRINLSSYINSISIGGNTISLTELTYPKYKYDSKKYERLDGWTGFSARTQLKCLILPHSASPCTQNTGNFKVITLVCSSEMQLLGYGAREFTEVYNITLPETYIGITNTSYKSSVTSICRNPTVFLPPNMINIDLELKWNLEKVTIPSKVVRCKIPEFRTKDSVKIPSSVKNLVSEYYSTWAILDMTGFDVPPALDSSSNFTTNGTLILLTKDNVDAFKTATNWSAGISKFIVVDENQ